MFGVQRSVQCWLFSDYYLGVDGRRAAVAPLFLSLSFSLSLFLSHSLSLSLALKTERVFVRTGTVTNPGGFVPEILSLVNSRGKLETMAALHLKLHTINFSREKFAKCILRSALPQAAQTRNWR